jgi:hypothetical protein
MDYSHLTMHFSALREAATRLRSADDYIVHIEAFRQEAFGLAQVFHPDKRANELQDEIGRTVDVIKARRLKMGPAGHEMRSETSRELLAAAAS